MKVEHLVRKLSLVLLGSSVLAGCGGLGEGVLPVSAAILPLGGLTGAASAKAYKCLNTGVSYILTFSDGSRGDFTLRSTYSSSNPSVAKVSNGDLPIPNADGMDSGFFYPRGTIVPVSTAPAGVPTTITVQYLSFSDTIDVTVDTPQNFRIVPADADLAAKSTLDLALFADLGGVETSLDSVATWAIETPDTTIATINAATGTLTGVKADSKVLVAKPAILGCPSSILNEQANVVVDTLQSLALTKEFASNDLVVATTERITATGTLANGKTQDLSNQVTYTATHTADTTSSNALVFFSGLLSNLVIANRAETTPAQINAKFILSAATTSSAEVAISTATPLSVTPVAAVLDSITVTPSTKAVLAGEVTQFNIVGTYDGGARTQDITRHVGWTSSDTVRATVQTTTASLVNGSAGRTATAGSGAGTMPVTITATTTNGASTPVTLTSTAALTIN